MLLKVIGNYQISFGIIGISFTKLGCGVAKVGCGITSVGCGVCGLASVGCGVCGLASVGCGVFCCCSAFFDCSGGPIMIADFGVGSCCFTKVGLEANGFVEVLANLGSGLGPYLICSS